MRIRLSLRIAGLVLLGWLSAAYAQPVDGDLFDLSLEELAHLQITSVSRKPEDAAKAASAVFVLTAEDIRRSGATTVAEALRLVPGLHVARLDSKRWAISARGFNNAFSMKLLVLIDGRTVYSPLFSGVEWDEQQVFLDDVERIEVVRGPGASLWGANAVNGVINIITKSSKDTLGGYAYAGGGKEEKVMTGARYGGTAGDNTSYRVYAKYFERDRFEHEQGGDSYDGWWGALSGFRADTQLSPEDLFTLQGDALHITEEQGYDTLPVAALFEDFHSEHGNENGGNILGRWTRTLDEGSDFQLQFYYAWLNRDDKALNHNVNTLDFDFQHRFPLFEDHDIVWGAGYRNDSTSTVGTFLLTFEPPDRTADLFTAFVQDEITIIAQRLRFIAGTKLEHNIYTGYEVQPTARLAWTPDAEQTVWGAFSRAVRTASRMEYDTDLFYGGSLDPAFGVPLVVRGGGNRSPKAENVQAYELGYRNQLSRSISIDAAAFYNNYDDHLGFRIAEQQLVNEPFPYMSIRTASSSVTGFRSQGAELALNWQARDDWRLTGAYSYINVDYDNSTPTNFDFMRIVTKEAPAHQYSVRSLFSVTENLDLDSTLRYVDRLFVGRWDDIANNTPILIPSYFELDLRLAWRPRSNLELALVGQNLLEDEHPEWAEGLFGQPFAQVERSLYAKISCRF